MFGPNTYGPITLGQTRLAPSLASFLNFYFSVAREMAPRGLFRPGAYVGRFVLPDLPGFPQDTYLEMTGWTKVNGAETILYY